MGGSRCSYQDCSSRSDGKIHMFHFPVFEKKRCHQWITNAQKPEFLNITLAQLRNKCICQHHFRDDAFMNYMKNKLVFSAVPTEPGPFCKVANSMSESADSISINAEDIENDNVIMPNAKKAHMSVKYGEFLTNDVNYVNDFNTDDQINVDFKEPYTNIENIINNNEDIDIFKSQIRTRNMSFSPQIKTRSFSAKKEHQTVKVLLSRLDEDKNKLNTSNDNKDLTQELKKEVPLQETPKNVKPNKKIAIISEKKISNFVKPKGKLRTVSPSFIIEIPKAKTNNNVSIQKTDKPPNEIPTHHVVIEVDGNQNVNQSFTIEASNNPPVGTGTIAPQNDLYSIEQFNLFDNSANNNTNSLLKPQELYNQNVNSSVGKVIDLTDQLQINNEEIQQPMCPNQFLSQPNEPNIQKSLIKNNAISQTQNISPLSTNPTTNHVKKLLKPTLSCSPQKTQMKSKLPPEKLAAIEEKRQFNMKIRDILSHCLVKLEDADSSKVIEEQKATSNANEQKKYLVDPFPALFSRIQRLEDSLSNRIDQNTQKIAELKRSIKPSTQQKVAVTQTHVTEEVRKKQLYQELSQYLSPNVNSILYEELFINKFISNETERPRKRGRKK